MWPAGKRGWVLKAFTVGCKCSCARCFPGSMSVVVSKFSPLGAAHALIFWAAAIVDLFLFLSIVQFPVLSGLAFLVHLF